LLITLACLVRPMLADLRARPERAVPGDMTAGRFWRFSAARALGVAIEFGLNWVDVLIVAALRPPAEAGVYAVASRCVQAGAVVDQATRIAAGPTISWHLAREERVEASELHLSVTRVATLISWPFYVTLIVMGPAVLGLFGDGFESGAFVVGLLAAVMMIVASTGMLQSILLMGGRSTWQVYNKSVALALSVIGNLLLVPVLGIAGAAVTSAVVVTVDTAIAAWLVHRRMGVHLAPLRLMRSGAVPLLVFGVGGGLLRWVLGTSTSDLFLWLAMLVPVYAVVVWILRDRLELEAIWHARHQGVDLQRVAQ
jgi:O-antigen/teichoic acid export membrane protein